jgi:uncharacterized protein YjcR
LSEAQVVDVRKRIAAGDRGVDIARDLGVNPTTICDIKKRRKWTHIP